MVVVGDEDSVANAKGADLDAVVAAPSGASPLAAVGVAGGGDDMTDDALEAEGAGAAAEAEAELEALRQSYS